MAILERYSWPGNVRELQSVLKQALLKGSGVELLPAFLPELGEVGPRGGARPVPSAAPRMTADPLEIDALIDRQLAGGSDHVYADVHRVVDKHLFHRLLAHTRGNQRDAAQILGISRQTMRSKLRAFAEQKGPSIEIEHDEEPS